MNPAVLERYSRDFGRSSCTLYLATRYAASRRWPVAHCHCRPLTAHPANCTTRPHAALCLCSYAAKEARPKLPDGRVMLVPYGAKHVGLCDAGGTRNGATYTVTTLSPAVNALVLPYYNKF